MSVLTEQGVSRSYTEVTEALLLHMFAPYVHVCVLTACVETKASSGFSAAGNFHLLPNVHSTKMKISQVTFHFNKTAGNLRSQAPYLQDKGTSIEKLLEYKVEYNRS